MKSRDPAADFPSKDHSLPSTAADFPFWQQKTRERLRQLSGLDRLVSGGEESLPEARQVEEPVTEKDHRRTRWELRTAADYWMPFYDLQPLEEQAGSKVLLAFHGHGRGKDEVAGVAHTDDERERITRLNYSYGLHAVQRGHRVFVPDMRGFGERSIGEDSCRRLNFSAIAAGLSLKAFHTWDAMRLVDHVQSLPECAGRSLGALGLSGGGGSTLWLAALEPRIEFAVISAFLKNYAIEHQGCMCNLVPGQLTVADRGEMAALILPRPIYIQAGRQDSGGPLSLVQSAFDRLKQAAELTGGPGPVLEIHDGGHCWCDAKVWDWIAGTS